MSDVARDRLNDTSVRFASTSNQLIEWTIAMTALSMAVLMGGDTHAITRIWLVTGSVAALSIWIVIQDLKTFTIADGAIVSIACLALFVRLADGDPLPAIGLDLLLTGGALLAFREIYFHLKGFDGLGLGDVKLAAAGGVLIGANAFAWSLLTASLLALSFVAIGFWLPRAGYGGVPWNSTDRLAFGAFLAPAIWLAWVAQHASLLLPFSGA